jgi:hypothetical protein
MASTKRDAQKLDQRHARHTRIDIREKIAVASLARELAHQLNNPLEAMTNLIYLARQKTDDEQVGRLLDESEAQLAHLSAVVQGILALENADHEQRLKRAGTLLDAQAIRRLKQEYESALHLASIVEGANADLAKLPRSRLLLWS